MRQVFLTSFFAAFLLAVSAWAERTISWNDLSPPLPDLSAPFAHLNDAQRDQLYELYKLEEWRKRDGNRDSKGVEAQIREARAGLATQKLKVDDLISELEAGMAEYNRNMSEPVRALDGQEVRLPGYVLPLEFSDQLAVSEFFLVPYVGACIHTPPPPANQIVLVKLNQSYRVSGLYDAVWVSGKLTVVENKRNLGYRDGRGQVTTTYELQGVEITAYE